MSEVLAILAILGFVAAILAFAMAGVCFYTSFWYAKNAELAKAGHLVAYDVRRADPPWYVKLYERVYPEG